MIPITRKGGDMRILVLGGTRFLGRAVAAEAVRRGHKVVCAARGEAGPVPDGAELVKVDRDAEDGLAPLAGERFDGVVDVATISYPWVRRALDALGAQADHWTFISSISAYANPSKVDDELLPPRQEQGERTPDADPTLYGSIKVACEQAVLESVGDRAFVVRAGLITGPDDEHDRFGYWPARLSRGGRVAVPDVDQLIQHVDVRDLAAWVVHAIESELVGVYDGIGPAAPLRDVLREIAEVVDPAAELVPVPEEKLLELGVTPWSGPRSLPLWLPASHRAMCSRNAAPAMTAGLKLRSLAETVVAALEHERALGLDRERKAGLTPQEEVEVLAAL